MLSIASAGRLFFIGPLLTLPSRLLAPYPIFWKMLGRVLGAGARRKPSSPFGLFLFCYSSVLSTAAPMSPLLLGELLCTVCLLRLHCGSRPLFSHCFAPRFCLLSYYTFVASNSDSHVGTDLPFMCHLSPR